MFVSCVSSLQTADDASVALRHYSRALQEFENKNYSDALDYIDKAIAANSRIARYFELRADIQHKLGNNEKAFRDYQTALGQRSNYPRVLLKMARLKMENNRFDEAISFFNRARSQQPQALFTYLAVAECYLQKREYAISNSQLEDYRRFSELESKPLAGDYYHVGARLSYEQEQYPAALARVEKALREKQATRNLALVHLDVLYKTDNDEKAYRLLSGPYSMVLEDADKHYYRGFYYLRHNNRADALTQLRLAVQKKCQIKAALALLNDLEQTPDTSVAAETEFSGKRFINIGLPDYLPL